MNKMCVFKLLLFAFFGILVFCQFKFSEEETITKSNVLFIICDDLNDYEGAFNGLPQAKTPNIDKLARSGVTFLNAHSNCPVCSPSRNSLFTGVYPHESKDFGWTKHFLQPILKHNKTLFEYFRENGYQVLGSGKILHVNRKEYWDEWGVDINNYGPFAFDGENQVGHPSVPEPFRSIGAVDGSYAPLSDVPEFPDREGVETGWIYSKESGKILRYNGADDRDLLPDEMHAQWAAKKISELENSDSDQPFFMGVGFVRPHTPLYAPQEFFDLFPLDEIKLSDIREGDAEDTHYKNIYPADIKGLRYYRTLKEAYGGDAEEGLRHFLQAYLACIAFVDHQIGIVIDALNNSKFKDNTIVVFTSDHGWQMGEKEYLFKNSPWEESTRIPFVIRAPDAKNGAKVDHPVSLIDIYPTLAELCGLEGDTRKNIQGGKLGGYSLKSFLEHPETTAWKGPDGALTMIGVGLNKDDAMKQTYSYRTSDWRYILYMDGAEELYHNKTDPFEWNNIVDEEEYAGVRKKLKDEMLKIINLR